jgi:beta-lactamase class A
MEMKKYLMLTILICLLVTCFHANSTAARPLEHTSKAQLYQKSCVDGGQKITLHSRELDSFIKQQNGFISFYYEDLTTNEVITHSGQIGLRAASTIKLPLVLYVYQLAAEKKLDLSMNLTYKKYHYYGGSGTIQNDPIGSTYTIRELVKKSIIYSDNIAFIMLKEMVGQQNFIQYLKNSGGTFAYPYGQNITSAKDLTCYMKNLYTFSASEKLGRELLFLLENTIFNVSVSDGIKDKAVAHKVGMIPKDNIYNDIALVNDENPYILAVMTQGIPSQSEKLIATFAAKIEKIHQEKYARRSVIYAHVKEPLIY